MSTYHSYEEDDEYRLPEGFERIGYDACTQTYYYRSPDGRTYSGEPGVRYGPLRPINSQYIAAGEKDIVRDNRELWRRVVQKSWSPRRWRNILLLRRNPFVRPCCEFPWCAQARKVGTV